MSQSWRFLLLEDSALDAEFLLDQLEEGGLGIQSVRVETRDEFEQQLLRHRFDVILADYSLPQFNGMEALGIAQQLQPQTPFIFVSGRLGEELAIESLQKGATDYVVKQRLERLVPAVKRALGEAKERQERRRIESALSVLSEASIVLASSLDYQTTLSSIARLAVPHFADCCMVDIVTEGGGLRRLDAVHVDESRCEWTARLREFSPPEEASRHPVPYVLAEGRPHLVRELPEDWIDRHIENADLQQLWREMPAFSVMIVPMEARGKVLGALTLISCKSERLYDEVDLRMAADLARRAALAVDNAQLHLRTVQAVRLRDEFLATVSHELRTPLNAVLGWVGLLRSGALDGEESEKALETIERNARAQAKLIEDLLDVSRIISGKLTLNTQPVDLEDIALTVADGLRPAALAKDVRLEVKTSTVPAESRTITGDPQRLQQVVWNLASNGIKFTPRGGSIQIGITAAEDQVELEVSDTGPGIAAEFLPHVFERFRQQDGSASRHYGGLGLGLAIVRHLAEMHGGTVEVQSPGRLGGASFVVSLPRVAPKDEEIPPAPELAAESQPSSSHSGKLSGQTLLVVDDDEDGRQAVATILRFQGAIVLEAASVGEAIEVIETTELDLVVSDIGMPGQDGYSLAGWLKEWERQRGRTLPAIALTAYNRESDRHQSRLAGFRGHVAKPVDPQLLASVILENSETAPG